MLLGTSTSSPALPSLLAHLAQERDTQVRVLGYLTVFCFYVSNSADAVSLWLLRCGRPFPGDDAGHEDQRLCHQEFRLCQDMMGRLAFRSFIEYLEVYKWCSVMSLFNLPDSLLLRLSSFNIFQYSVFIFSQHSRFADRLLLNHRKDPIFTNSSWTLLTQTRAPCYRPFWRVLQTVPVPVSPIGLHVFLNHRCYLASFSIS